MENIFLTGLVALGAFFVGRISLSGKLGQATSETKQAQTEVAEVRTELNKVKSQLDETKSLFNETLNGIRNDSALLTSLVRWADRVQSAYDETIVRGLRTKMRPARKAAEEVRIARAERRQAVSEREIALNRIDLYERLAPWLFEYTDLTLSELFASIREEEDLKTAAERGEDPVSRFIPQADWNRLSPSERNQIALERYCNPNRRRTPWAAGIEYERFVGYNFEQLEYKVRYQGAVNGFNDAGLDLICEKDTHVLAIQCKRLSPERGIPIRENVIAQVYGAAAFHGMVNGGGKSVRPILISTYKLSDEAKRFARYLNVIVKENFLLQPYPLIKCNVSPLNGEKIYHLPMDQQYDKVIVGDHPGEFYAWTVQEAENRGFRRAFRWRGN